MRRIEQLINNPSIGNACPSDDVLHILIGALKILLAVSGAEEIEKVTCAMLSPLTACHKQTKKSLVKPPSQ